MTNQELIQVTEQLQTAENWIIITSDGTSTITNARSTNTDLLQMLIGLIGSSERLKTAATLALAIHDDATSETADNEEEVSND